MSGRMTGMMLGVSWTFLHGPVTHSMPHYGTVCTREAAVASGRKYTPSSIEVALTIYVCIVLVEGKLCWANVKP